MSTAHLRNIFFESQVHRSCVREPVLFWMGFPFFIAGTNSYQSKIGKGKQQRRQYVKKLVWNPVGWKQYCNYIH